MLNQADFCKWTDEGNGVFSFGLCAVSMRVEGTRWDVTLPSGSHVQGPGASPNQAKQLAFNEFVKFSIRQLVDHKVHLPTHAAT